MIVQQMANIDVRIWKHKCLSYIRNFN